MATVVLSSDEVLDGVREITAKLKVWSSISGVSCNGVKVRLEVRAVTEVSRAWRNKVVIRDLMKRRSY
jgi:hypothetical protein